VQSGDADVFDRGTGSTACSSSDVLLPLAVLHLLLAVLFLLLVVLGPFSSALSILVAGGWRQRKKRARGSRVCSGRGVL
jgi:hypothetical protein